MPTDFRKATIQFSLFFLAACLIATPFAGPGPLVAWVLATAGLVGVGHAVERKRPSDKPKKPTERKCR